MNNITCPICNSKELTSEVSTQTDQLPLGPQFDFKKVIYTCSNCGEKGDFERVNDSKFLEAYKPALVESVKQMINKLSEENDISMAYFERVFELPVRTLTRWKSGDFSATAVALLRTVKTFPWITEVAENKFEPTLAAATLIQESGNTIYSILNNTHAWSGGVSITNKPESFSVNASLNVVKAKQEQQTLISTSA